MKSRIAILRKVRRDLIYRLESMRGRLRDGWWQQILEDDVRRFQSQLVRPEEYEGEHDWYRGQIAELTREFASLRRLPKLIEVGEAKLRSLTHQLKLAAHKKARNRNCDPNDSLLRERSSRKQKGWHEAYMPTRARYWRPLNNNWKRHRKTQYRTH